MNISVPEKSPEIIERKTRTSPLSNALEQLNAGFFITVTKYAGKNIYSDAAKIGSRLNRKFRVKKVGESDFQVHRLT